MNSRVMCKLMAFWKGLFSTLTEEYLWKWIALYLKIVSDSFFTIPQWYFNSFCPAYPMNKVIFFPCHFCVSKKVCDLLLLHRKPRKTCIYKMEKQSDWQVRKDRKRIVILVNLCLCLSWKKYFMWLKCKIISC